MIRGFNCVVLLYYLTVSYVCERPLFNSSWLPAEGGSVSFINNIFFVLWIKMVCVIRLVAWGIGSKL